MKDCDCENCPLSWEDWSYEGDCDCGCMWYGDSYEWYENLCGNGFVCRLPLFAKEIIYKIKKRQLDKRQFKFYRELYKDILDYYKEYEKEQK